MKRLLSITLFSCIFSGLASQQAQADLSSDCVGYMKGHGVKNSREVKVCITGNEHYYDSAVRLVMKKNWFPEATKVDEVRFVCTEESIKEARVLFPTQKEIEGGFLVRVELPCTFGYKRIPRALKAARILLRDQTAHSEKIVKESVFPKSGCGIKSKAAGKLRIKKDAECAVLREQVASIVDTEESLGALPELAFYPTRYGRIAFNAGVEDKKAKPVKTVKAAPMVTPPSEDSYKKLNLTNPNSDEFRKWVTDQIPTCETKKDPNTYLDTVSDFSACEKNAQAALDFLDKHGISISAAWNVEVNGVDCGIIDASDAADIRAKCELGRQAGLAFERAIQAEAYAKPVDFNSANVDQWRSQDEDYTSFIVLRDGGNIYGKPVEYMEFCGWDAQCWSRMQRIKDAVTQQSWEYMAQFGSDRFGKCAQVVGVTYDSNGNPKIQYALVDCDEE